jgi:NAD dependent epimerase/dehydratase family enzyme
MAPLKLQTLLGVGGRIGPGSQWWPWISLHDEVRALAYLVNYDTNQTVFNLVGPTPSTSLDMTIELARALKRPHWLGLPSFAITALMGEAGEALLLTSQKVHSQRLGIIGFTFDDQTLGHAIRRMVNQGR